MARSDREPLQGLITDRPCVMIICGKKNSGKSTLLANLLRDPRAFKNRFVKIIFVSPTFSAQYHTLWKCLHPDGIEVYEQVTNRLIEHIIATQEQNPEPVLLVFDDVASDLKDIDQYLFNKLVAISRHLNLSIVVLCQKFTFVPTTLRANCDVFCVFAACSYIELDALWKEISVLEKKPFIELFKNVTRERHSFLCISIEAGRIELFPNFRPLRS